MAPAGPGPRRTTAAARGAWALSWPRAALLSLSDKAGVESFARALEARGTRLLASAGTAAHLERAGIAVTRLEAWTGFDELLGGRVKTLHPHVHAPVLARRGEPADMRELSERGLDPIDLVAVTLYPFEARAGSLEDKGAVEEIDIGGVALLRAAAKNFADVIVVHEPAQYPEVLGALEAEGPTLEQRREWAVQAFARTARYDAAIADHFSTGAGSEEPPADHVVALERVRPLRYGENPHQRAALYARAGERAALEAWREGKELSYNNLLDLEAAVSLVWRLDGPACVIVKHGQPCGAAAAKDAAAAYQAALRSDELSAFGGVVAFNRKLDGETARRMAEQFVECVAAPELSDEAREIFERKKNLRAVRLAAEDVTPSDVWSVRFCGRWALMQREGQEPPAWRVVTRHAPTPLEMRSLEFAWQVAAAARSNAVAIARESMLVGLGAGQTSRVDAVDVALMKARRAGHEIRGAVMASDGFFPFPDGVEHAAEAGITAVVQPGGSVRDAEVIAACDARAIAMAFTDRRTFRH